RIGNPQAVGMATLAGGFSAFLEGRWKQAYELCERSGSIFREQCTGVAYELNMANHYGTLALELLGDLKEMASRLPALLRDAADRRDLSAATNLRARVSYLVLLMKDRPNEAADAIRHALDAWSRGGFHLQHYWELSGRTDVSHYRGDAPAAWEF